MIHLSFFVEDISSVIKVYNQIEVQSSSSETGTFTNVNGIGFPIWLTSTQTTYTADDPDGSADTWYRSRYSCSESGGNSTCRTNGCAGKTSSWSDPVLGETADICYVPSEEYYTVEVGYKTSEQLVIDQVRKLIGDPVGLKREYNELDNIHPDKKVYELEEKGWPCSIKIGDTIYKNTSNPKVNGYRYLRFNDEIITATTSGIDVFYYTFRNSDREIFELYNTSYPPAPLTGANTTTEVYMLQTAIILLRQELIEDSVEDGATIVDESSRYSPDGGLKIREAVIDRLQKRLDAIIKSLLLCNITGVLID